ncbi:MAG: hypothetical protein AAF423_00620 [Pseudomonadota bacterium]
MIKQLFSSALFIFLTTAVHAESVYTTLDLEKGCVFHSEYEQGASAYCSGYKGYPVHFSEGDLRQMMRFGHVGKLEGQWESFGQFNRVNTTIEWRIKEGKPYATILRWFIENSNDSGEYTKALEGQVLVVSRIANHENPTSCVVGYVDARSNSDANLLAQNLADTGAASFVCGTDKPVFHGERGKFSGDPVSWFD